MDGILKPMEADKGDSDVKIQQDKKQEPAMQQDRDNKRLSTIQGKLAQLARQQNNGRNKIDELHRAQEGLSQFVYSIDLKQNKQALLKPIERKLINIQKKAPINTQIRDQINKFVQNTTRLRTNQYLVQLDRKIKTDILSQSNILMQMQKISYQIFAFVSGRFKQVYPNYKQVLFRSVRLRCGDIYENDSVREQAQKIMLNWVSWGPYFFDLEVISNNWTQQKTKLSKNKIYKNQMHDMTLQLQQGNVISVKLKGRQITSESFQIEHLKKMAYQRLQQYAKTLYAKFYRTKILIQN